MATFFVISQKNDTLSISNYPDIHWLKDQFCIPVSIALSFILRLLSKCIAKQQNGCMQDLDAVLGCTIWMIPDDTYDKLESLSNQELNTLCDANFYCLNWFRELINTFSNDEKLHDEDKR